MPPAGRVGTSKDSATESTSGTAVRSFDGPSDSPPASTAAASTAAAGGYGPGLGYDPARMEPRPTRPERRGGLFELPPDAFRDSQSYFFSTGLPNRPSYSNQGKEIDVAVNQFKVNSWPSKKVYQYDLHVGNGAEKRGMIMAAWKSRTLQEKLSFGKMWLFDGNKIAWCDSMPPGRGEMRLTIDMDAERGRAPRVDGRTGQVRQNTITVRMKQVGEINMAVIEAYLTKKIPFDNAVLEAITFLDHCMRQFPSEHYVQLKRSFFSRDANVRRAMLTGGKPQGFVEAMKGVYSSMRLCQHIQGATTGLAVNVDVANGTFWAPLSLLITARNLVARNKRGNSDWNSFVQWLRPKPFQGSYTMSDDFKMLRRLVKVKFSVKHRGKESEGKTYTIKGLLFDPKYGPEGAHSKNVKFLMRDKTKPDAEPTEISVYDYFYKQYNIKLTHWALPLIKTEKDGTFPLEVCNVISHQAFKYKLDPDETSDMIKFAVTKPSDRRDTVQHGVQMLKWNEDPYLRHYGVKIDPNMTVTKARLLPNPIIQMGEWTQKIDPKTSGKWDLRGKKFYKPNPEPLESWGVCVMDGCVELPALKNFLATFIQTYVNLGGKVKNRTPSLHQAGRGESPPDVVAAIRQKILDDCKGVEPQIILFILRDKDAILYNRLKKNMECRFGGVSQMMQSQHVQKAQAQYCANVCMKLNAKLGGTTSRIAGKTKDAAIPGAPLPFFQKPGKTMILGADVSHPSPGSPQPSIAAVTMSADADCCRYAAQVDTNGHRVEMITTAFWLEKWAKLVKWWVKTVGNGYLPEHLYYFRDGVSEGQYQQVLDNEVRDMKMILKQMYSEAADAVKFTVIVASKRHHLRFFPKQADPKGNALPGTLVERDITHPFEYDFYLCSHVALQGTSRPTHYHVLLDEMNVPPNILQNLIYQQCYQYMRSTTPVSLFPAVYYAHLASKRAMAHEGVPGDSLPRGGQKFTENKQDANILAGMRGISISGGSAKQSIDYHTEVPPLTEMGKGNTCTLAIRSKINTSMWYI